MYKMLAAVIVSTVLIQGCTTKPKMAELAVIADKAQVPEEPEQFLRYVGNNENGGVLTGNGDCLRSVGWSSNNMKLECQASSKGEMVAEKAAAPQRLAHLSYDGTALFAFDSAKLSSEGRRELGNLVAKLNGNSQLAQIGGIAVVGHADNVGTNNYNQTLSEHRAVAVRQFLKSALKNVDVITKGMGESAPIADNTTSTGRQRNRRVEVKIDAVEANAVFN